MTTRLLLFVLHLGLALPALAAPCEDCTVKCCAQTVLGQVCAPVCQQECAAEQQHCGVETPTTGAPTLTPLSPATDTALAEPPPGMLLPGWQAIAEQALGDIRKVEMQMHPHADAGGSAAADPVAVQPVIDDFIKTAGKAPDAATRASSQQLVDSLWQASARDDANDLAAERLARSYTFASAAAQLSRSVYGGPAGAAAYAAWWAYRQPGATPAQAVRIGLLVGAGLWDADKDGDTAVQNTPVVQRTSVAAALGGVAVAAAGGDEQALRRMFFTPGAAVLVQDGRRPFCLSATVQCGDLSSQAAAYKEGQFAGWPLAQLHAEAVDPGTAFPVDTVWPTVTPLARRQGSVALGQGWVLSWQAPRNLAADALYPMVALTRSDASQQAATVTAALEQLPATAAGPAASAQGFPAGTPSAASIPGASAAAPAAANPGSPAPADATSRYECERKGELRSIWVLPANPQAGYVCRTMYQLSKINSQAVLWNALQNPQVCDAKARAQVDREQAQGFSCRAVNAQTAGQ